MRSGGEPDEGSLNDSNAETTLFHTASRACPICAIEDAQPG